MSITNPADLYTVLKFEEVAGILDDVEGADLSRKKIGMAPNAEGGNAEWWSQG